MSIFRTFLSQVHWFGKTKHFQFKANLHDESGTFQKDEQMKYRTFLKVLHFPQVSFKVNTDETFIPQQWICVSAGISVGLLPVSWVYHMYILLVRGVYDHLCEHELCRQRNLKPIHKHVNSFTITDRTLYTGLCTLFFSIS